MSSKLKREKAALPGRFNFLDRHDINNINQFGYERQKAIAEATRKQNQQNKLKHLLFILAVALIATIPMAMPPADAAANEKARIQASIEQAKRDGSYPDQRLAQGLGFTFPIDYDWE